MFCVHVCGGGGFGIESGGQCGPHKDEMSKGLKEIRE